LDEEDRRWKWEDTLDIKWPMQEEQMGGSEKRCLALEKQPVAIEKGWMMLKKWMGVSLKR
jgi:hypothetical protein